MGKIIETRLSGLPHILGILGLGLLLGIKLDVPARDIQAAALKQSIIIGTSADPNVLRHMPTMVVTYSDIEHMASVLGAVRHAI